MSTAFFDALSIFRPTGTALSREKQSQVQVHRLLSLLGALFVPLFGPLYAAANPEAVDPAWARYGIGALFVVLFLASYVLTNVCRHFVKWMRAMLYLLTTWFVVVTAVNGFSGNYALGLLLVFAVLAVVVGLGVETSGPALRFLGFGFLLTTAAGLLGPEPQISLPILLLSMATVATVGGVVIEAQLAIQKEIRKAKKEAEEASRLKSAMLANMSHELRTPLTSINGFAEVLKENLDGRMRRFAEKIYKSGQRLLRTFQSVLQLSQLEAGTFEPEPEPVELTELVENTARRLEPEAEQKQVALRMAVPKEPVWAQANKAAAERIAENLLENAIKFTPTDGSVEIRVHPDGDERILEVEDTGIGIEQEAIPHVFEPFRQESEGLGRKYEGVGVGLSITHELTQALGGSIEVESEKEEGTRMVVRLPKTDDPSQAEENS